MSSRQHKHLRRSAEVTQRYETMSRGNVHVKIAFSAVSLAFHLCLWTLRLFSFSREKCKISPDHPQGCGLLLKRLMMRWICASVCLHLHVFAMCAYTIQQSKPVYTKGSIHQISEHMSLKGNVYASGYVEIAYYSTLTVSVV